MRCDLPRWMEDVFDWFMEGKISERTLFDVTDWLIEKHIITCYDIV